MRSMLDALRANMRRRKNLSRLERLSRAGDWKNDALLSFKALGVFFLFVLGTALLAGVLQDYARSEIIPWLIILCVIGMIAAYSVGKK